MNACAQFWKQIFLRVDIIFAKSNSVLNEKEKKLFVFIMLPKSVALGETQLSPQLVGKYLRIIFIVSMPARPRHNRRAAGIQQLI